jgi:glycosyltransferase involved in cell wall biosynthesis
MLGDLFMEKIKLLEIVRDADGGMKSHVETLISNLDHEKFAVTVACSAKQLKEFKNIKNIAVYEIAVGDQQNIFCILKSLFSLIKIIKKNKIHIVHAHGTSCTIVGTCAALISRKPVSITTIHNFPVQQNIGLKQLLINRIAGFLIKYNSRVIAVSANLANCINALWHIPEDKIHVIHNGISSDAMDLKLVFYTKYSDSPKIILNISRLVPQKGVDIFLQSIAYILQNQESGLDLACKRCNLTPCPSDLKFLIAGDGPEHLKLRKIAETLGIEKNVIFLGFRKDIKELISISDIVALCSRSEGMGISLLEALSLKKPVIATQVGGIPEVITNGKTGILVPPENPKSLCCAIKFALSYTNFMKILAERGHSMIGDKFSLETMILKTENLLFEVIKNV